MTLPGDDDAPMRIGGAAAGVAIRTPAKFRLVEEIRPEDELHASVADALDKLLLPPARWTTFPAGSVPLPPRYAAKLSRLGLKRGWPDVQIVFGGRIYGVELKRRGGKLSRTRIVRTRRGSLRELVGQEDEFPRLREAGMEIAVCNSLPAVLAFLSAWGVPLRPYTDMAA